LNHKRDLLDTQIICKCGETLLFDFHDSKYHGCFIPYQDYSELTDFISKNYSISSRLTNDIFQCKHCHNLILFTLQGRFDFMPADKTFNYSNVLMSVHGQFWKGFIHGDFEKNQGVLLWETNIDTGRVSQLSLDELKVKYFEKKTELIAKGVLEYSRLLNNGDLIDAYDINE
jgi:hypothetical protein